jgi:hypothetical protein
MSVEPFQQRVATFSRHHRLDAPPFAGGALARATRVGSPLDRLPHGSRARSARLTACRARSMRSAESGTS